MSLGSILQSYLRNDKNVDPTEVEKQLEWVENKILHRYLTNRIMTPGFKF